MKERSHSMARAAWGRILTSRITSSITLSLKIPVRFFLKFYDSLDYGIAYQFRARVNQCRGEFARAIPDFTMAIQLDSAN